MAEDTEGKHPDATVEAEFIGKHFEGREGDKNSEYLADAVEDLLRNNRPKLIEKLREKIPDLKDNDLIVKKTSKKSRP